MTSIEQTLKNEYREALSKCKFSDKRKLYKLYEAPKRTTVSRKIIISYAVLAAAIMLLLLTGAAAAYTLYDAVLYRTKGIDITDEKREEMVENLEEWGMTAEDVMSRDYEIGVNENGDTYGHAFDGVDLIAVAGHESQGNPTGYVYREDFLYIQLDPAEGATSIEEILQNQEDIQNGKVRNWIYVYDSDGYTVIGKYVQEITPYDTMIYGEHTEEEMDQIIMERFKERQERVGDFEFGFNTNEELENPEYDKLIIYGSDYRNYVQMAQNRSKEIKNHLKDKESTDIN